MSLRGFGGIQTLTGSAVPVYGTTLSAATQLNPDFYTGNTQPGSNRSSCAVSVAVGTGSRFRAGDRIAIGVAGAFEQGNSLQTDGGDVQKVSGDVLTVIGLTRNHASGEFVVLTLPVAAFSVQLISASGNVYLGEDATVGAASTTLLEEMNAAGFFQYGQNNIAGVLDVSHLWISGGAGSQFIPSLNTV